MRIIREDNGRKVTNDLCANKCPNVKHLKRKLKFAQFWDWQRSASYANRMPKLRNLTKQTIKTVLAFSEPP